VAGQVLVLVPVDEPDVELGRVGRGDVVEERALLDAVAAPDAADDEHLRLAGEGAEQLPLGVGQADGLVELLPPPLLLRRAGGDVPVVRNGGLELPGEERAIHADGRCGGEEKG
jgi:hypothetical protein